MQIILFPQIYLSQQKQLNCLVHVEKLNSKSPNSIKRLSGIVPHWCILSAIKTPKLLVSNLESISNENVQIV